MYTNIVNNVVLYFTVILTCKRCNDDYLISVCNVEI